MLVTDGMNGTRTARSDMKSYMYQFACIRLYRYGIAMAALSISQPCNQQQEGASSHDDPSIRRSAG